MSLQRLLQNFTAYTAWAHETIIAYLQTKPRETWYAEVPSSFNSIVRTLNHILATQEFWYSVVTGTEHLSTRGKNTDPDAEEVFSALIRHTQLLHEAVAAFSEEALMQPVTVKTAWFESTVPRYEYIMQMLNHTTYHRGQITTIGRSLGFTDASNTDYHFFNVMVAGRQPA